jgi:hypothetical protein
LLPHPRRKNKNAARMGHQDLYESLWGNLSVDWEVHAPAGREAGATYRTGTSCYIAEGYMFRLSEA